MDHIDGPVQGTGAKLTGPQFSPGTVVFDEEKIVASVMVLSVKSRGGVAGETDIPVRIDTDSACIIGSGGTQLLGPGFVAAGVILDQEQIQFSGMGVAVQRSSGITRDVGVSRGISCDIEGHVIGKGSQLLGPLQISG